MTRQQLDQSRQIDNGGLESIKSSIEMNQTVIGQVYCGSDGKEIYGYNLTKT